MGKNVWLKRRRKREIKKIVQAAIEKHKKFKGDHLKMVKKIAAEYIKLTRSADGITEVASEYMLSEREQNG
tara:strand:+ start:14450 stop:14662 length:213 start_codon:yes stop_codon:yes gene_type:complete